MLSFKIHKIGVTILLFVFVILCCKSQDAEAGRVIFYGPRKNTVYTGQILSTSPKKEPCPKCQMRDHRGRCRRIISFNPGKK